MIPCSRKYSNCLDSEKYLKPHLNHIDFLVLELIRQNKRKRSVLEKTLIIRDIMYSSPYSHVTQNSCPNPQTFHSIFDKPYKFASIVIHFGHRITVFIEILHA